MGTPIFRDERVDLGFYAQDSASDVAVELQVATYLFLKTVATLPANFEERGLVYSTRTPLEITMAGAMSNALHECEHHLGDATENLLLVTPLSSLPADERRRQVKRSVAFPTSREGASMKLTVAAAQMSSGADPSHNLEEAERSSTAAADQGAPATCNYPSTSISSVRSRASRASPKRFPARPRYEWPPSPNPVL